MSTINVRLTENFYSDKSIAHAFHSCSPNSLGFLTVWSSLAKKALQSGKPMKRDAKLEKVSLVVEVDDSLLNSPIFKVMRHEDLARVTDEEAPSVVSEQKYEEWFKSYPYRDRNGTKVKVRGKSKVRFFNEIRTMDQFNDLMVATKQYSEACNKLPKDPERFLKDGFWKEWIPSFIEDKVISVTNSATAVTEEQLDKMLQ